jgi:hypothetical protein
VSCPSTSHHGFSDEQLRAAGIDPGTIHVPRRGNAADVIDDVEQAIAGGKAWCRRAANHERSRLGLADLTALRGDCPTLAGVWQLGVLTSVPAAGASRFVLMVPLASRIRLGFYRDGVWADAGFLPYQRIRRLAFRESPEIELILLPRGGSGSFRLPVPPDEYGAVRKLLEEKIREHVVNVETGILGL